MADEHTASTITWLNLALHNCQKSTTLINQNKSLQPKPTIKFCDLNKTILGQEVDGNESEMGDGSNEDEDAWLDGSINLVNESDTGYLCCSNQIFIGSKDACLGGPELLNILSDKAIELKLQNQLQTPGPSSEVADDGPVAWKFSFSQIL
ncbi:hypothetical protein BDR05DRAFT_947349 [Suillus weaverae]|nr:hypothetical protein BDR05DRAFT_947349 [Suillus weaverae]